MAYSIYDIQKRTDERFPTQGFKILEFRSVQEKCRILCPKHGEQVVSSFNNFIRGKVGCPACAAEIRANTLNSERSKALEISKVLQQLVGDLRRESENLTDEAFGRLVRIKLSELNF